MLPSSRFLFPDVYGSLSLCALPLENPCGEKQETQIHLPRLDQAVPGLFNRPLKKGCPHSIWQLHLSGLGSVPYPQPPIKGGHSKHLAPRTHSGPLSLGLGLGGPQQFWDVVPSTSAPFFPNPRPCTPQAPCKLSSSLPSSLHALSHIGWCGQIGSGSQRCEDLVWLRGRGSSAFSPLLSFKLNLTALSSAQATPLSGWVRTTPELQASTFLPLQTHIPNSPQRHGQG